MQDEPHKTKTVSSKKKNKTSARTATTTKPPTKLLASQSVLSTGCGSLGPLNASMADASHPILKKMSEYQQVCGGDFLHHAMIFTAIPDNGSEVGFWSADIAASLKNFASYGVKPLVVLEPSAQLNLQSFSTGSHDAVMQQYFSAIRAAGISDAMMGQWVLFPEANIPAWGNTNPDTFAANVTRTARILKSTFPSAKATIMLDSKTYPSDDIGYIRGKYSSLVPYVQNIPRGLLDSFGFQGFPWAPPANAIDIASVDPAVFLNVSLAHEAAQVLGLQDIWLNTGTFQTYYASDPARRVTYTPQSRQTILTSIAAQAASLKSQGYSVNINLFSEDKSAVAEAVDWSYWQTGLYGQSQHTAVFKTFAGQLSNSGIPLGIFDTIH